MRRATTSSRSSSSSPPWRWCSTPHRAPSSEGRRLPDGALLVAGLAAGLAAGTKLNYLLPAFVLVVGIALAAPNGARLRSLGLGGLAALAGGGYWYLRNLAHTGNPLPWFTDLGPISLPGPDQTLGGREGHSVLGYLTDGSVWSDWLLPGLHHGLTLLLAAAGRRRPRRPPPRPRPALHPSCGSPAPSASPPPSPG